ncbi:MAG TPA: hypothetical protein VED40_16230 [Azospirillaceae bacterium]|nr:hypothetical protein [Azospirillaceae bacterium]
MQSTNARAIPVADVLGGGVVNDGSGIVVSFRLGNGQEMQLYMDSRTGSKSVLYFQKMLSEAARMFPAGTAGVTPGDDLYDATEMTLHGRGADGFVLTASGPSGPPRNIRFSRAMLSQLAEAFGKADREQPKAG